MQVILSNNIRIRNCPGPVKAKITKMLTMENPEYIKRKQRKKPTWGIEPYIKNYSFDINGDLICPRGFYEELKKLNLNYTLIKNFTKSQKVEFGQWNENYKLYNFQNNAVYAALTKYEYGGVLIAPAGSGKTNMALNYVYHLKCPTLWITHTKDLMNQTKKRAETLISNIGKIGLIGDGKKTFGDKKFIIAMVQTLQRNPELIEILKDFIGVVIIDEAHHVPTYTFTNIINQFPAEHMLGVTATPDRKDQLEKLMYLAIGPEVARIDREELYKDKILTKPKIEFVFTDFEYSYDTENIDAGGEDLNYNELMAALLEDNDRAELIVSKIIEGWQKYGTSIVLSENIRYCYKLYSFLLEQIKNLKDKPKIAVVHGPLSQYTWYTVKTEAEAIYAVKVKRAVEYKKAGGKYKVKFRQYTDGEMKTRQITKKQRTEIINKFKNKEIDILFATQIAREGLDVPHLAVGHMVTPKRGDVSNSRDDGAAVEQEIGRVMRADPNNPEKVAIWYDYVDDKVGVFKSQYYSRRRTYKRLGIPLPRKKSDTDEVEQLLKFISY